MGLEATAILYGPYSTNRVGDCLDRPINVTSGGCMPQTQA